MRQMHAVDVDTAGLNWWNIFQTKAKRKLELLHSAQLELPKQDLILGYYQKHMELVRDRPIKFQHGDYHVGNMLICDGRLAIIDFDKMAAADPYEEFKPFIWNVWASPQFATGIIDGYFTDQIPTDFFPILALYAADSLIGSLPWAERFGAEEVRVALEGAQAVLTWYADFTLVRPTWYQHTT